MLVTFHPATLEEQAPAKQMSKLLAALSNKSDTTLIFTMPNADTGGLAIKEQIQSFVEKNDNAYMFESLGQLNYLSCMAIVDGVVGNSSSGILEAPSLKVGTINIGSRQLGRTQSQSVINVEPNTDELIWALEKLYSKDFKAILRTCKSPYGDGGASDQILRKLRDSNLIGIIKKSFFDLG